MASRVAPGMDERTEPANPLTVWMDGQCQLCEASRGWCESRDNSGKLEFTDFRTAADGELPVARENLESSMWVRDRDGTLLEGFEAWRRIMAELPGWRWLAGLTGVPPLRWMGPWLYRAVARNRHRLPSF